MSNFTELMNSDRPFVYFLLEDEPHKTLNNRFRVAFVFKDVFGYFATGTNEKAAWYWDKETCQKQNESLGHSESNVQAIILSSIRQISRFN